MKKYSILLLILISFFGSVFAQKIQSPSEFLGYKLGEQFTPHYRIVAYYQYLASVSKNIKLQNYGTTNEGRPLFVAFVGSSKNIQRLEDIRKSNLLRAGIKDYFSPSIANGILKDQPVLVWFSYNVHGNESVSSEASLQTVYDLLDPTNKRTQAWLENTLLILDPCLNPDGRERYVNFYNPIKNLVPNALPFAREHMEPWPGGRTNHYYFDLNRDWVWQSQVESQQRIVVYNSWLPQVHVDFHEQGIDDPYYFAPAAEPYHQDISQWQREFQTIIGKNNAKYFDRNGWMYFTKESFDLLYPSYGDTYPVYNGSIGMTYEQGGSGRAGLTVINAEKDTLTLKNRIDHHYTSGLSTIESASQYADKVLAEFGRYFKVSKSNPPGEFKTYVIKGENPEKIKSLASLLQKNGIEYGFGSVKGGQGFNYFTGKSENFKIENADMVISAYQPKSILLKVLFEPNTYVSDSATYDITAWSLPYAYGILAYASKESLKPAYKSAPEVLDADMQVIDPVAYVANWNSLSDVKFLVELLNMNIKVRYSEVPFEISGKTFNAGSLIIARNGNNNISGGFENTVKEISGRSGISLFALSTAFVDKGADLGSSKVRYIKKPKIVVVGGESVSSLSLGEIWHFFEQQLNYSVSIVRPQDLNWVYWNEFDVLIYPDGNYTDMVNEKMLAWIRAGGKLIAMKGAISGLVGKKGFDLKNKEEAKKDDKDPYGDLKTYEKRERENVTENIPGAIYKVDLDNTHPLGFGFPKFYHTLKLDDKVYKFLNKGWNVGVVKKENYVSGFVGVEVKKKLIDGLIFGVQEMGSGTVIYMADDPLFRSFWENGKLLFSNAVFMVGQ